MIEHYLISFRERCNEIESNFYINKIYDGRQFKEMWSAQKIHWKFKNSGKFKSPFVDELGSFFAVIYQKKKG
jgi:hypothetical protein